MDPPECDGHSHGGDLVVSLRPQIGLPAVSCLNVEIRNSGRAILKIHKERLSTLSSLRSQDDDPELLSHIPFTEAVTCQSISIQNVVDAGVEAVP